MQLHQEGKQWTSSRRFLQLQFSVSRLLTLDNHWAQEVDLAKNSYFFDEQNIKTNAIDCSKIIINRTWIIFSKNDNLIQSTISFLKRLHKIYRVNFQPLELFLSNPHNIFTKFITQKVCCFLYSSRERMRLSFWFTTYSGKLFFRARKWKRVNRNIFLIQ